MKIIINLFYILIPVSIYLAFLWAPPAEILGDASRIIYFHVPMAWLSTLSFILSGIFSIVYLYDKEKKYTLIEEKACNSAGIGVVFAIITTIQGSIWAKISWGVYWNWDPREVSIIILLLIYIAYFSLRTSLEDNPGRGRLTSVYLIIAMAIVPILIFVVPRVYSSLHPDPLINPERKMQLEDTMRITLFFSLTSFTLLYFYIFSLANRISKIKQRIQEKYYEA